MILAIIEKMITISDILRENILQDIEDVKNANHDKLLDRNDIKLNYMEQLVSLKEELDNNLMQQMQDGKDVNIYRQDVDNLEMNLTQLSKLNTQLGTIVLPIREMYKQIVDDITKINGGSLFEVRA
jgi:hypothetical protein